MPLIAAILLCLCATAPAQTARDLARADTGAANLEAGWERNPARLGQAEGYEVNASGFYDGLADYGSGMSGVVPGGASGALGGSLISGQGRTEAGLGYGKNINGPLRVGASLFASKSGTQSSNRFGVGGLWRFMDYFQAGLAAEFTANGNSAFPFRGGLGLRLPPVYGAGELDLEFDGDPLRNSGKFAFEQPLFGEALALRLGADLGAKNDILSAGLGLNIGQFRLDYAWYAESGAFGSHALTLHWHPFHSITAIQAPPPPTLPEGEELPKPPASEIPVDPKSGPAPIIE